MNEREREKVKREDEQRSVFPSVARSVTIWRHFDDCARLRNLLASDDEGDDAYSQRLQKHPLQESMKQLRSGGW